MNQNKLLWVALGILALTQVGTLWWFNTKEAAAQTTICVPDATAGTIIGGGFADVGGLGANQTTSFGVGNGATVTCNSGTRQFTSFIENAAGANVGISFLCLQ